jgi:hypothetical protein
MGVSKKNIIACTFLALLFLSINKQNSATIPVNDFATSRYPGRIMNIVNDSIDSSGETLMDSILMIGKKFIGKPYRYRMPDYWAFDCSGFAAYLYSLFGYVIPHSAPGQALLGKTVPMDSLKKGDLMFFKGRSTRSSGVGHTAIFYKTSRDTIYFLHSASSGIRIDHYNGYAYYTARYLFSKRLNLNELKRVPVTKIDLAKLDSVLHSYQSNSSNKKAAVTKAGSAKNTSPAENGKVHIVKKGDTLYAIAQKYGTTVDKLCAMNGIKKNAILKIGQKIRLK